MTSTSNWSKLHSWPLAISTWFICMGIVTAGGALTAWFKLADEGMAIGSIALATLVAWLLNRAIAIRLYHRYPWLARFAGLFLIFCLLQVILLTALGFDIKHRFAHLAPLPFWLAKLRVPSDFLSFTTESSSLTLLLGYLFPYGFVAGTLAWVLGIVLQLTLEGLRVYSAITGWLIGVSLIIATAVYSPQAHFPHPGVATFTIVSLLVLWVSLFNRAVANWLFRHYTWLAPLAGITIVLSLAQGVLYALFSDYCSNASPLTSLACWPSHLWPEIRTVPSLGVLPAEQRTIELLLDGLIGGTIVWLLSIAWQLTWAGLRASAAVWLLRHWRQVTAGWLLGVAGSAYLLWTSPWRRPSDSVEVLYWSVLLVGFVAFTGLGLLAVLYLNRVYVRAGRSNNISGRNFFSLDWRTPHLLDHLLSQNETSYMALRFRVSDLSPLAQVLYLNLDPNSVTDEDDALRVLVAQGIPPDRGDVVDALITLTDRRLFQGEEQGYHFVQPELATIYHQTFIAHQHNDLINQARAQSPVYAETQQVFTQLEFEVSAELSDTLLLVPHEPDLRKRLGGQVIVRIMGDQPVKGADIQKIARVAQETYETVNGALRERVAFIVVNQPPEAGAQAQMTAYRLNEGFIIVPLSRALVPHLDQHELNLILNDYLDPVHVEVIRFFTQSGFDITSELQNSLLLAPNNQTWRARLGEQVLVHIACDRPVRGADIQTIVKEAEQAYGGKADALRKRVAFIVVTHSPDAGGRAQMYTYRFENGFIVVPLNHGRLRTALTDNTTESELDYILSDYLSERVDLYDHRGPVRDEDFFGRVQVAEELQALLEQNQPLGIFALNKMGKTSLIRNLAERLMDRPVAVVDLQAYSKTVKPVYPAIVEGLARDISKKWSRATVPPLKLLAAPPPDDLIMALTADLTTLHEVLATQTNEPRFVVFIDEIDLLIPGEDSTRATGFAGYGDLLASLRGLSQQGMPLTFVVVGIRARINRAGQLAGVENAGFQMFRELFLPPMPPVECNQMIRDIGQLMGLSYTHEALDCIFRESGGHPFLARQLCSLAWNQLDPTERSGQKITLDEARMQKTANDFIEDSRASYLADLWSTRLNPAEQAVVQRLAAADTPQAASREERQTWNSLLERYIVAQENDTYRLAFNLFRRWIRTYILDLEE